MRKNVGIVIIYVSMFMDFLCQLLYFVVVVFMSVVLLMTIVVLSGTTDDI